MSFLEGEESSFSMEEDDDERSSSPGASLVSVGSMTRRQARGQLERRRLGGRGEL